MTAPLQGECWGCEECQGLPYGVSLRLPLDTGQRYRLRRNAVKGRGLPLFISTLDGEGADTLIPQGKAAASPLAPFRAGGIGSRDWSLGHCRGQSRLGEHWEQSDLCEGLALQLPARASFHFVRNGITCYTILTMGFCCAKIHVKMRVKEGAEMAHMMKHTKASCGHMFAHYDRREDNISNENLDRTRTHLNYNLATHQQMDQGEFVRQRCSEVHCQNRKDVNVMVSWVITAPKDLQAEQERDFFQASYDFLEKKYGKENVVSAYVHMDEATPHMHFAFVPVVPDERRGYKVSAKECVNKAHLATFHEELQKYLQENEIGVKILNNATREGNKSIRTLKRGTAVERVRQLALQNRQLKQELEGIQAQIRSIQENYDKYAAMESLPAFMKLPAVKKAYDNYVKGLKKEDRPSIRKKLDTLQKQISDSQANPLQKEQAKKNSRKNDYHR